MLPGVVHIALEVPEWSHVVWLRLSGFVPCSHDHYVVARGQGERNLPKAPGIWIGALDDVGCRPGRSTIDGEFDPPNRISLARYGIALHQSWPRRDGLAFLWRGDDRVQC